MYVTRGSASSNERGDLGATLGKSPSAGVGDGSERIGAIREYQIEKSNLRGGEGEKRPATAKSAECATTKEGRTSAISVTQAGGLASFLETRGG